MTVKTTFVNGVSPFEKPLAQLKITADKPVKVGHRLSKYDHIFEQLERGQGVECAVADVNTVGIALRAWLKRNGKSGRRKQVKLYPGAEKTATPSRVWWV